MQRRQLVQSPSLSLKALATLVRVCLPFADRIPTLSGSRSSISFALTQSTSWSFVLPLPACLRALAAYLLRGIEAKHSDFYTESRNAV